MRNYFLIPLLLVFLVSTKGLAQEIFIKTGINSTTYAFRNSNGIRLLDFTPGSGSSLEIGMGFPFVEKKLEKGDKLPVVRSYAPNWFKNEVSLTMDSFNGFGGDRNNNYSWETTYGGLTNTLSFLVHVGEVELGIRGHLGLAGMLSGTQVINSSRFPLKGQADFSGSFAKAGVGASVSYPVFQRGFLNLTYTYANTTRLGGPKEEKVSFLTHALLFGLYVQLQ
uniref:hypothetical protein n=1 Tax=Algoriphagus sp. TaxID=1872435 RepID=UPI0040489DC4